MTVTTSQAAKVINGNGVLTSWSLGMTLLSSTDAVVTVLTAAGVSTALTLNVDYSISSAGYGNTASINYPLSGSPLPVGAKLTITRNSSTLQDFYDVTRASTFNAAQIEEAIDRAVLLIQDLNESVGRALLAPQGTGELGEIPANREGKFLAFDDAGAFTVRDETGTIWPYAVNFDLEADFISTDLSSFDEGAYVLAAGRLHKKTAGALASDPDSVKDGWRYATVEGPLALNGATTFASAPTILSGTVSRVELYDYDISSTNAGILEDIPEEFSGIECTLYNYLPSIDLEALAIQVGTAGSGGAFLESSVYIDQRTISSGATATASSSTSVAWGLTPSIKNTAVAYRGFGKFWLTGFNTTSGTIRGGGQFGGAGTSLALTAVERTFVLNSTGVFNAIKIASASGSIESLRIKIDGVLK